MGIEIERKYLVSGEAWRTGNPSRYRQGYLSLDPERIVRVRVADDTAFLTVKSIPQGITRREYEYTIPHGDAVEMLDLCEGSVVEKLRHRVPQGSLVWEIDEFLGDNAGLIVAEVELPSESHPFTKPDWVAEDVTDDPRYSNSRLAQHPFTQW